MASLDEDTLYAAGEAARKALGGNNAVFIGLMGAGKSVIGKLVAQYCGLSFRDTDMEIEKAAQMSIPEIFAAYGEPEFRALEERVVRRVLEDEQQVVSTGGGAFMNEATRENILKSSLSVWLKADFDVLWPRVSKRNTRPLLQLPNPQKVLRDLIDERYPTYAQADITITSRNVSKHQVVLESMQAIAQSGTILETKTGASM